MQDPFALFGLPYRFALDLRALESSYLEIQSRVHPDRFAHAGDAERRASLQWTTRVNEAYRSLRDPVQRAKELLQLQGVDVAFETNTQMPGDFLLQQLDLREELERAALAKDAAKLDQLRSRLAVQRQSIESEIQDRIDLKKDYLAAAELVRKLMFLGKVDAEIDLAYEAVD